MLKSLQLKIPPLVLVALFVLAMNRLQIAPEERALRQHFGPEYERYLASVRRWI